MLHDECPCDTCGMTRRASAPLNCLNGVSTLRACPTTGSVARILGDNTGQFLWGLYDTLNPSGESDHGSAACPMNDVPEFKAGGLT